MAVVNVTACFRFAKFITDNTINFRHISASRFVLTFSFSGQRGRFSRKGIHGRMTQYFLSLNIAPFGKFSWTGRKFTATTSENTQDKPVEGADGGKNPDTEKLQTDFENISKELASLNETLANLQDKYKRSLAENENLRVRLTKQVEDAKLFGIQGFCKDLVEVSDILQKAMESVPKEEVNDKNPHLKNLFEGLTMTEAELQRLFKKHGLLPIDPINQKFDPNQHEALFQKEVEGKEPGTIFVVTKIGYKLHERVIRPALVGVAKSPS